MNLPSGPQRGYIMLILLVFDLQFTNQSLDLYPCASCLDCVIVAVFCLMRRSYKIGLRVRKLYQCTSTILNIIHGEKEVIREAFYLCGLGRR